MEKHVEMKIARWRETYAGKRRFLFVIRYGDPAAPVRPDLWPSKKAERLEWLKRNYEYLLARSALLDDDLVPYLDIGTGTEVFAECFGCRVHRPEDTLPCAIPLVKTAAQADALSVPALEGSPLGLIFELADAARAWAPDAPIKLSDMQSPMDVAAQVWDKNELFVAMAEAPEAVKRLAEKTKRLIVLFYDEWIRRYGREYISHCPENYMERGISLSVDEVGSVSAAMFRDFFLPELDELSARYGGIGIHCCANARHQWENFKQVKGLRLMNLILREPKLEGALEAFAGTCVQYHTIRPKAPDAYPPAARVVLEANVGTLDEARRLADEWARTYRG